MHIDHVLRRGPLLTLGLGTLMLITVGVLYAPSTDASVDAGGPPAPTGDSVVLEWRSDGPRDEGERTPTPVPDDGVDEAPEPVTGEEVPTSPSDDATPAVAAPVAVEDVQVPGTDDGLEPMPEPEVTAAQPEPPADEPVATPQALPEPVLAESVVLERPGSRPMPDGMIESQASETLPVVHAGPGPAEPVDGAITLIDPLVIERP
jgi:hypothetical protein